MIKFLFLMAFSLILFPIRNFYFWAVRNVFVARLIMFIFLNLELTDFRLIRDVISLDILSYSLVVLSV